MDVHAPLEERVDRGRAGRKRAPRSGQGEWKAAPDRADPIAILEASGRDRVEELLPIRYGRMASSAFGFYRGAASVMAADLATLPHSGIRVQACGDAHLANFGVFASPERKLVFDLNDFDETLPGPWEWDVKRLAASLEVAARHLDVPPETGARAARAAARTYRLRMQELARLGVLDRWYAQVELDQVIGFVAARNAKQAKSLEHQAAKVRRRTSLSVLPKLTALVDGQRRIVDQPPLIQHGTFDSVPMRRVFESYLATLPPERAVLIQQYRFVDAARKVVGVGSVGTRCHVVLMVGRDDGDPLFLQVKEAGESVLAPHVGPSRYDNHGQRVVLGQHLVQASSDIFLGWTRGPEGRDFYVRQLRDMKFSVDIEAMTAGRLVQYAALCGYTLARAHARTGDPVAISSYLGRRDTFEAAMVRFAAAYADQNAKDHARLLEAIGSGRIVASTDDGQPWRPTRISGTVLGAPVG
ncbi:MAG: hypothetical protein JWL73_1641 [Actinomycetia bacterium]|nr:hypothetical protein [Actinomycetes bacterium]